MTSKKSRTSCAVTTQPVRQQKPREKLADDLERIAELLDRGLMSRALQEAAREVHERNCWHHWRLRMRRSWKDDLEYMCAADIALERLHSISCGYGDARTAAHLRKLAAQLRDKSVTIEAVPVDHFAPSVDKLKAAKDLEASESDPVEECQRSGHWVPASSLVNAEVPDINSPAKVKRFCERHGIPNRQGTTKGGKPHPRRRDVQFESWTKKRAALDQEKGKLQDAADKLTEDKSKFESWRCRDVGGRVK